MYTMLRSTPVRELVLNEAPALGVSLVIAEVFYKFGSFTLECAAFLLTWSVLSAATRYTFRKT